MILLLSAAASCGGVAGTPAASEAPAETAAAAADETTTEQRISDNLPADLDLGGMKIRVLTFPTYLKGEDDGEVVNTALYKANLAVEERLGIAFDFTLVGDIDVDETARESILAGSDDYDIVSPLIGFKREPDEPLLCIQRIRSAISRSVDALLGR